MFWTVATLLTACSSGGADYTLHLTPVTASAQAPFDGLERLDLVLTPDVGDALRVSLGAPTSGSTPDISGLPALVDTRIAVEGYIGDDVVLRGLTEPLTAAHGTVDADVFVASTETTAWLGSLTEGINGGMLVPLGGGTFWMAGGATNNFQGEPFKGVADAFTLSLAPPDASLAFTPATALPAYEDEDGATQTVRMGATATPLTVAGADQGKVLVAGGAPTSYWSTNAAVPVTAAASLYDPATDTWEDITALNALESGRASHIALENLRGNVVFWGGYSDISTETTVEYYDSAKRKFSGLGTPFNARDASAPKLGGIDAAIADLGKDGTLICGGAVIDGATWTSGTLCVQVALDGSSAASFGHDLPVGVAGAAMLTLPDGRVLLTGGANADTDVSNGEGYDTPATDQTWFYDPTSQSWEDGAPMQIARAGHRMVLLADGRVLIIGGSGSYNFVHASPDALSCLEIFDPVGGTFSVVDGCVATDDAGGMPLRAYQPEVAYDPDYGVLVAGGLGADGSAQTGVSLFVPAP